MISRLVVQQFRGIPGRVELAFGRITLLAGRNGLGKTTIFDAIDWCLFGAACRLGEDLDSLHNLYAAGGAPHVTLTITLNGHQSVIERTLSGATFDGDAISDRDLTSHLIRDPDIFPPYARDVTSRLRRMTYLPQADIRQLLTSANSSERRALLHVLLGVPNASLVESTIRRINQRISERQRDLEVTRAQLAEDILALLANIPKPSVPESDVDPIADARAFLLDSLSEADSPDALLTLLRAEIDRIRNRRVQLSALETLIRETADAKRQVIEDIANNTRALTALEQDLQLARTRLEALNSRRQALKLETASLRGAYLSASRRAEELSGRLALLRALLESDALLAEYTQAAEGARQIARHTRAEYEQIASQLSTLQERANRLQDDVLQQETTQDTLQKAMELRLSRVRARSELELQITEHRQQRDLLLRQLPDLEQALHRQEETLAQAEYLYNVETGRAPSIDRLSSLLADLQGLVRTLQLAACPLCGRPYGDTASLLQHLEHEATKRSEEQRVLRDLRERTDSNRQLLSQLRSNLTTTRQLQVTVERELEDLEERYRLLAEPPASDIPNALDESTLQDLRDELHAANAQLTELRLLSTTTSEQATRASLDSTVAEEALNDLTRRSQQIRQQLGSPVPSLPELESQTNAQLDLATTHMNALQQAETQESEVATEERALELDIATSDALRAELKASLTGSRERLDVLERGLQEHASDLLGQPTADLLARTSQELRMLAERDTTATEIASRVEDVVRARTSEDNRSQARILQDALTATDQKLEDIARASTRFSLLAAAAERRSRQEAQMAAKQIEAAIQECLSQLYPHRHLDRVDLHIQDGDILLTDRLLTQAVQAERYSSTGQLNVLALSVFIAVALRQRVSKLSTLMLDEPVQNLDDVHFLAFIALLKRIALSKQVVLSTADANVAEIMKRQMKNLTGIGGDFIQYDWRDFDPVGGPEVVAFGLDSSPGGRKLQTSA